MRIHTTQTELTANDIATICLRHEGALGRAMRLKRYYRGEHDILRKEQRANNAPNNKIVSNYCAYIADMSTGFFMGKPVAYSSLSEDEAEVDALQEVFKYNDEAAHNLELASEASVTGEAYELLYMDEDAKIRFCSVPSEEVILVCNASLEEEILYAIRHYRVYHLDGVTYD
ncbi:MAG: phage portal protein, partial [Veillonellaceae bacterium]|nr:phage portal protein [Veillonellaceae bacterium]